MEKPICETCPYWDAEPSGTHGSCRRNAPSPLLWHPIRDRYDLADHAWWPITGREDCCGEHPSFPAYIAATKAAATRKKTAPAPKRSKKRQALKSR